ncbi:hypothetical protein ACT4US_29760 [Bacillus sp. HC-Mk]
MACALEKNFGDIISKEKVSVLKLLTSYKRNISSKFKLAFNKEIRMVDKQL